MLSKARHHLDKVEESYCEHFLIAAGFGVRLIGAGLAAFIHAICPALFEYTASSTVDKLAAELQARRKAV